MRILAVSDEECPALWDHYRPGRLDGYDLILSAGDLKADYLSFLVTMAHAPLLYVHGNHDEGYARRPPEGCDCIDDQLVVYRGVRILGLGGCLRYRPDAVFQYSHRLCVMDEFNAVYLSHLNFIMVCRHILFTHKVKDRYA